MVGKSPCFAQRRFTGDKAQGLGSVPAVEEGPGSGSPAEGQEQSQLQTSARHVFLNQNKINLKKINSQKKTEGRDRPSPGEHRLRWG